MKCTQCETVSDFMVNVKLTIIPFRKTIQGTPEEIKNSRIETQENLCLDCFNKFIKKIDIKEENNVSES